MEPRSTPNPTTDSARPTMPRAVVAALAARRDALTRMRGTGMTPKLASGTLGAMGAGAGPTIDTPADVQTDDRARKAPRLRLVAADPDQVVRPSLQPTQHEPISDTADPRWVLAVRAAEKLEGSILRPEHRERLLLQGKSMGLTPFDTSLILAIVQDQARRGHAPAYCPTAAEPQLRMVPPVRRGAWAFCANWSAKKWLAVGAGVALFTAVEFAALSWFFSG